MVHIWKTSDNILNISADVIMIKLFPCSTQLSMKFQLPIKNLNAEK